jgi:hypothetical protein
MANKLISELTTLGSGSIESGDYVEVQENDLAVTKKVTVTVLNELEAAARAAQDDVIEAACGLDADGSYPGFSGSNYLDATSDIVDALDALDNAIGASDVITEIVSVTSANLNNAGVSPYEIVAAPGATAVIEVIACSIRLAFNAEAVDCGVQKLVLEYDTGASYFMEWSNAFIQGGATAIAKGTWTSNVTMITNKKLQLTFDGGANPTAGDSTLKVFITYKIWDWDV